MQLSCIKGRNVGQRNVSALTKRQEKNRLRCTNTMCQDSHQKNTKMNFGVKGPTALRQPRCISLVLLLLLLPCRCSCATVGPPKTPVPFRGNGSLGFVGVPLGCVSPKTGFPGLEGHRTLAALNFSPSEGSRTAGACNMTMTSHGSAAKQFDGSIAAGLPAGDALQHFGAEFPGAARQARTLRVLQSSSRFPSWWLEVSAYFFLWLYHWHVRPPVRRSKTGRKRCKTRHHARTHSRRRFVGSCLHIKGRRYRVQHKRYRRLGQKKRAQLLKAVHTAHWCPNVTARTKTIAPRLSFYQKIISWLVSWLGCRVGEASHPGPGRGSGGGARATKRKAETIESNEDRSDSGLAAALLEFVQQHQRRGPQTSTGPPNKKGKGGPQPEKQAGSPLARILLQTLQAALRQGLPDDVVANRVINKITRHGPSESGGDFDVKTQKTSFAQADTNSAKAPLSGTKQQLGEHLFPKISKVSWQAGKVTGMLLEAPVNDINCWLDSDTLLREKVREAESCLRNPGKDTWADKVKSTPDLIPHAVKTKGGKGKSPQSNKDPPPKVRAPLPNLLLNRNKNLRHVPWLLNGLATLRSPISLKSFTLCGKEIPSLET